MANSQTRDSTLSNRDLLEAFWWLTWYQESPSVPPNRVNYAALDVEELGSVYESLLEFHPVIALDAQGQPAFDLISGSERKTTGSYYTPPQLVNELVQSALVPVIRERLAAHPQEQAKALLSIRVCDPACGSGHFLLAAARCLGKELAKQRTGEEEPAPESVREAIREVISHCIYGVDKNPLAVDLCRVALWLESHTGDKPLTFLDHRIRCGDSLVGVFDLSTLAAGIPDKAFESLEGDDKPTARDLARRNRKEREGQLGLFAWSPGNILTEFTRHNLDLDAIADDSPEEIRHKKQLFEQSHADPAWYRQKLACDLWTVAFFQPLNPDTPAITSGILAEHLAGRLPDGRLLGCAEALSWQHRFFHWPLEFPEVFVDGGFDVLLSNPPWEHVELKEQEFFAARDARIATAPTKAVRARLIQELREDNPDLYAEFVEALRGFDAARLFLGETGRYPFTGRGRINTYAVFAELCRELIRAGGRSGIIVPSGIATDDTTKFFFQDLVSTSSLFSLLDFENRKGIFPAIDSRMKFCLLTLVHATTMESSRAADLIFFALDVDDLRRAEKRFTLTPEELTLLNPNTGNCPIFRSQADAELTKAIYRRVPVLWREATADQSEVNPWKIKFSQGLFNMSSDSHHFRTAEELELDGYRREGNLFAGPYDRYLPLYESKMLHQFDHRWATYKNATDARDVTEEEKRDPALVVQPRYWVREEVVESAIPKYPESLALALQLEHRPSVQRLLCYWAAGYCLNRGDRERAQRFFETALPFNLDRQVSRSVGVVDEADLAVELDRDFPIGEAVAQAIAESLEVPEVLAGELVERFSPRWFLGWRDICRSTDERTLIACVTPRAPVGHTFPLAFFPGIAPPVLTLLLANLNSFAADYAARQKVGGTHITYNLLKQFPLFDPHFWAEDSLLVGGTPAREWIIPRVIELVYTAQDLAPLARDCGYDGPPFSWDGARRFEIRCELDAAFFHLYLPCEPGGDWRRVDGETSDQLTSLKRHFPTPRAAVAYVLDQFPIIRQKDEQVHGCFRTKDRILAIYDAMLEAQRTGRAFRSMLSPPPGQGG